MSLDPVSVPAKGLKSTVQLHKVFFAATKDPAAPGAWTEAPEVQYETSQDRSGPLPGDCRLKEYALDSGGSRKASLALVPNSETAKTGDGTDGTTFCGVHLTVGSLIRVQVQTFGSSGYEEMFLGVVADMRLVGHGSELAIEYTALDYRYFMDRVILCGKTVYDPTTEDLQFLRATRVTFNENGQPDRAQLGVALGSGGGDIDFQGFIKPRYNRNDSTDTGAPVDATKLWADFWLLGHIWNYLRTVYSTTTFPAISYTYCGGFICTWPQAVAGGALAYLFTDGGSPAQRRLIQDFAVTGMSLAAVVDAVLKRAGPYEWTVKPGTGANLGKIEIVVFPIHVGADVYDFTWGDAGDSVAHADPDVAEINVSRTQRHFFNRGLALGRKKVFEITLDTVTGSLIPNWDATMSAGGAQYEYCQSIGTANEDDLHFRRVFLEWRAPDDLNWTTDFFGGSKTQRLDRPALKQLLTWALDPDSVTNAKPRVYVYPILWRKDPDSGDWLLMSSDVSLEILPDICGFRLGAEARKSRKGGGTEVDQAAWPVGTAYSWNLDPESPALRNFRITLAVEADECILAEIDNTGSGERALEFFFDGANAYRSAYRSKCLLPTKTVGGVEVPVVDGPFTTAAGTPFGAGSPATFIDDQPKLASTLKIKMDQRYTTNLEGSIVLHGLRTGLVGSLVGTLMVVPVEGEEEEGTLNRTEIVLNACIRAAVLDRDNNTTTLQLNGF